MIGRIFISKSFKQPGSSLSFSAPSCPSTQSFPRISYGPIALLTHYITHKKIGSYAFSNKSGLSTHHLKHPTLLWDWNAFYLILLLFKLEIPVSISLRDRHLGGKHSSDSCNYHWQHCSLTHFGQWNIKYFTI